MALFPHGEPVPQARQLRRFSSKREHSDDVDCERDRCPRENERDCKREEGGHVVLVRRPHTRPSTGR